MKKLNYTFKDIKLFETALTHRSKGGEHNERLEFLGDAVVNFVVADILFELYPDATEGTLSRYRASLVNREALYDLAMLFQLGDYVILGQGEIQSGGRERHSTLSCTMEAVIGAVYLDGGFDAIAHALREWYKPLLSEFSSKDSHKDPKTLLQEYLQSRHLSLPIYTVTATEGESHNHVFTITCHIEGVKNQTTGKGTSRRRAEQEAAENMLSELKK